LNWLFCPTCNELEITPKEKGVVTRVISDTKRPCFRCAGAFSPLIVPPTFYKDLNNVFLSTIWNRIDIAVQKVKHIVFCGYSFPDADIHIKYLLKRAQTNRDGDLTFTVMNHHPGKDVDLVSQEISLRALSWHWRQLHPQVFQSFEDFSNDPFDVIPHTPGH
jgi:hypothetical protein